MTTPLSPTARNILGVSRILLGWIFLWAFVDKVFGLGYATEAGKAWLDGVSPTAGFLQFGTSGPLAEVFRQLSGSVVTDLLFMGGLLGAGLALMLGIGVRVAGYAGALQMFLIYLSVMPPEHNPLVDEHIVYITLLLLYTQLPVGDWYGLGRWWKRLPIVQRYPWLW